MVELLDGQSHHTPSSRRWTQTPSCEQAFQDLYPEMIQSQPLVLGRLIPILPFDTNPAPSIILLSGLPPRIGDTIHICVTPSLTPFVQCTAQPTPFGWSGGLGLLVFISHVLIYVLNMC
jgi:hypothetical protein